MLLLKEQEDVSAGVDGMEREFVQAQADLVRFNANKQKMHQEQRKLNQRLRQTKDRMNEVLEKLEHEQREKLVVIRKSRELEATKKIEQMRSERLQDELNKTQALLVDATSAAAESKHALEGCNHALERL